MVTLPNDVTADTQATILVTTLDGTEQRAIWYDLDAEVRVGKITRGSQRWGVDHDEYTSTALNTAFGTPITDDGHYFPCIGISYNNDDTVRRTYAWGHMWSSTFRMARTTSTTGGMDTWESTTLPNLSSIYQSGTETTYPNTIQYTNGDLGIYIRGGESGDGNSYLWRLPKGSDTWTGPTEIFRGHDTGSDDWSAYPTRFHYDPIYSRWWVSWIWRDVVPSGVNLYPACMYSDDDMTTWKSADGTTLTMPLDETSHLTYPKLGLNWVAMGGEAIFDNYGGMCTDSYGNPWVVASRDPHYVSRWFGDVGGVGAWTQHPLGSTGGTTLDGRSLLSRINPVWIHDSLWLLALGSDTGGRSVRLFKYDGTTSVSMSPIQCTNDAGWEPSYDEVAHRLFGSCETLWLDGNTPHVSTFGNHRSLVAA